MSCAESLLEFGGFTLLASTLLVLSALAFDPGTPQLWGRPDTEMSWAATPDPDVTVELMPGFAAQLGVNGWARIRCYQRQDGHPYNCRVVDERPYGLGFGAAARVIVASGELKLGRAGGTPVPGEMQTTVRFYVQDELSWKGPEPTKIQMQLARQLVDRALARDEPEYDDSLDGLDYDRRSVVQSWMDELFPEERAQRRETLALQLARVASEADLRRLLAGQHVAMPDEQLFEAAAPTSDVQKRATEELKRRYCARYDCDSSEEVNSNR